MASDRSIKTTLTAEISQFKSAMGEAAKSTDQVGKSAENASKKGGSALDRLSKTATDNKEAWTKSGTAMVAVGGSILAIGAAALKTGIAYNTLQQTSRAALKTLLGSTKAANAQMDKLDEFARNSPFAKGVFITAQQQLLGFGVAANKVLPTLDAIQNTVAAFGGSNEQIASIADIMARINSQGRLSGDALERLGYYGVDAAKIIGDEMGKTSAEIKDMASKPGGIPVAQIWDPLVNGMQAKFGGAAANVKDTFVGSLDRVKAAWRDLSSELAAPLVGPGGGGAAVGGLNKLADAMRAFQNLPGPVKASAVAVTGLGAAATFLGGSFLILAPRIVATKVALSTLGAQAPRTAAAIKVAGAAMGAAFLGVTVALAVFMKRSAEAAAITERMKAASTGFAGSLDTQTGAITGQTREMVANSLAQDGLVAGAKKYGVSLDLITNAALGGADPQKNLAEQLTAAGNAAGNDQDFIKFAAGINESVMAASDGKKEWKDGADALKGMGGAAGKAGGDVKATAEEAKAAAEAMAKIKGATRDAALSFFDFGKGLDSNKTSFAGWIKGLQEMAAAQRNWQKNMVTAQTLGATDDVIAKFQELGPKGAKMLAELVKGGVPAVEALNKVLDKAGTSADNFADKMHGALAKIPPEVRTKFATEGADISLAKALKLAKQYNLTPEQVKTLLDANDVASNKIARVLANLRAANGQSATVTLTTRQQTIKETFINPPKNIGGKGSFGDIYIPGQRDHAAGGSIQGPGTGTSDSIPAMLSNGEHVLTAAEVAKAGGQNAIYRLRAAIMRGNVSGFAAGGSLKDTASERRSKLRAAAAKRKRDREKAVKDAKKLSNDQRQERADLRADYSTQFRRDAFLPGATGDLSGAYSAIDQLIELSKNKAISSTDRKGLAKTAAAAEKGMKALFAQADALTKQLDSALDIQKSIASGLSGSSTSVDFFSEFRTGGDYVDGKFSKTGSDLATEYAGKAASLKAFIPLLEAGRKAGLPPALLSEIAGLGSVQGTAVLNSFLNSPTSAEDISSIQQSYKDIESFSSKAGEIVAFAFDLTGAGKSSADGMADGFILGLQDKQSSINKQMTAFGEGLIRSLRKSLDMHSPSRKMQKAAWDTADGFILGITDKQVSAERAMVRMASMPQFRAAPSAGSNTAMAAQFAAGVAASGTSGVDVGALVAEVRALRADTQQVSKVLAGMPADYKLNERKTGGR